MLTRLLFQRSLAAVYFIAFLASAEQFRGLIGEHGLLPARLFLKHVQLWQSPTLFWLNPSDAMMATLAWLGAGLSLFALGGWSERFGAWVSAAVWSLLWLFYLSFVNAGQTFYSFGWETMMLEAGFLAIFLGSRDVEPPVVVIWFLRWVLFRLMLGAGLIKLRGDECWRDLTAMFYHYETQPIPNPLSWYFHHLPKPFLKFQTLYTFFVELPVPFLYFLGRPFRHVGGILTVGFQACLILSGNLSWLNYITLVLCVSCFDDAFWGKLVPVKMPAPAAAGGARKTLLHCLTALILVLSIAPTVNLFSPRQMMNASFDPLHLVNTYGAFGSITKHRTEVILEGTDETTVTSATRWREYEFKAKPGDIHRRPPVVAPYHLRLDWLMWFAAMSPWRYHPWILNLTAKLLKNDKEILKLIDKNPFPGKPPRHIRGVLYSYRFTTPEEKKATGDWWVRKPVTLYLPPVSLENESFRHLLREMDWE